MGTRRQKRVSDQIREILSELLLFEVADPRLDSVTIMEVVIDRELMVAKVYVHAQTQDTPRTEILATLEKASGFMRRELGKRIRIQHTPELRFEWDETLEYGEQIDTLLASLHIPPPDDNPGDESS
jgi:ribosome-binding factor A